MEVDDIISKINKDREKVEASFVFCLWKNPPLYDDYKDIDDKFLTSKDALFYYYLGRALREQGLNVFDALSLGNYLTSRPEIKKRFDGYGGWKEVEELMNLTNDENIGAYFDEINKDNYLVNHVQQNTKLYERIDDLKKMTLDDIYMTFDGINTALALSNNQEAVVQDMTITKGDIDQMKTGQAVGVSYRKAFPMLNYTTLGLPKGDIMLLTGHSGTGKSSFAFTMLIAVTEEDNPVCIISNEMQIEAYKNMLLVYVLTKELAYYNVTRKKLKQGNWSEEDEKMILKAQDIINEKYAKKIFFVKMFGNNSSIVIREMKKMNRLYGVKVFCWDTYKADDTMTDKMWQELLMSSRKVFNMVAKEEFSLICTFQLALYTTNQRYLDAGCLSNSKQIKEVVSEHIMLRKLWADEYSGEKYDCKPYTYENKIKTYLTLDKDKLYVVIFIDKTRNDDNAKCILCKWDTSWNRWQEIGYCTIVNDHKGI